jgi:transcriptional antiterminator RfaH
MTWYLIHTKPKQEGRALQNLVQQGYECFLPFFASERIKQGALAVVHEPLFPRYIFIRLHDGPEAQSWSPIRSTKGVHRLVMFGPNAAKVSDDLIDILRARQSEGEVQPMRLFNPGEKVVVTQGAFAGIEGVYEMTDGEQRAMVLIELLSRSTRLKVPFSQLRKNL